MQTIPLIDKEDVKVGRKGKRNKGMETLTKKSSYEKDGLIEKLELKEKRRIEIKKTIRIPVHYDVTKNKMDILVRLTERITYGIRLIGELVSDLYGDTFINGEQHKETAKAVLKLSDDNDLNSILKLSVIEEIVNNNNIIEKTGLQSTYVQQCINKVIFSYKSHRKLHKEWEGKVERTEERLEKTRDDKERAKGEKCKITAKAVLEKLMKIEPSKPDFRDKTSCRLDWRTGVVECAKEKGKFPLWIHISTLEKGKTIDIPLNPSVYHLNQLKEVVVDDFEIIKGGNSRKNKNKYYIHVSITKVVEEKSINSIGGIDQGLNKSIAAVLIPLDCRLDNNGSFPREEQLLDSAKVELLEKYEEILASLQEAEKWDKLRQLRNKRENVSIYHDWCLARNVADFTEGSYVAIGNSKFRQTQFKGNRMPGLRKIGKWSYGRQRKFIELKRSEMGYRTELRDEYGSSRECCSCHSKLTRRVWEDGFSYLLCHDCGMKKDADLNAGNVIATRCRDDMLKAGMIRMENPVSLQDGSCPCDRAAVRELKPTKSAL